MQRSRPLTTLSRHLLQKSNLRVFSRSFTGTSVTDQEHRSNGKKLYETHVPISNIERTVLTVASAVTALNDPYRGDMIATLGEATGRKFLASMRDQMLESSVGRRILRERPVINTRALDFDKLKRTCAPGTFGQVYISWLEAQGVTPDTRCDVKFVDDEELAYVIKRYREIHDFFHTLTGLGVTVEEEIALKWFEWAQTGLPMTMLASLFGPLQLSWPERKRLYTGYVPWALQCGASCQPLMNVYFEEHFHTPLDEFRKQLGITMPPQFYDK
ncbi:ubiquinone biosynthesis protein Coq4 [Mucor mucedo]|uniref:ubiquinone biosynthesis protein Coq4 n=1 Tax=Mucor mucedo TaxID=29922 RepID=UPI00221EFBC1|nr:ubiquinone biosynthesis protein Coq4 [Mucor mucedo]KAI7893956.1 ubiquinone biosynthesis protein Coq4 [Mucor mucedo]